MAKSKGLTEKTELALKGLNELGGSATLEDLKTAGFEVGSANLTSLLKNEKVTVEDVTIEYVATKTVKKYTVIAE